MATLVLGTVGTLIGGPIGGAIGSLIGNGLDRTLLGSKRQQGPRLGDLSVQTSSYGSQIPRLFGTMRVAGTVIWSTDLREEKHSSGSAKGGGPTTSYTYSASFAVAISARPILSVGRIWADGNLLRGAAGDWKADTGFRLYPGDERQTPDPLIAAAEGITLTPGHRGLAYAVFENLQLADFGNRIPSLTFEVVADGGPVAVPAIAAALTDGAVAGEGGVLLDGFAASGDSVRDALDALTQACPMPLADDGAILRLDDGSRTAIDPAMLGAASDAKPSPVLVRDRQDAGTLPDTVSLRYYEPARDYQAGLQRARRDGIGRRETALDLPAAVSADAARLLAEQALARAWTERDAATVRVPWRALAARVGTLVSLADGSSWRIAGWTLDRMALELRLRPVTPAQAAQPGADAGRAVAGPDAPAGRTVVALLDLPALDDKLATAPGLWLAAAGTGAGWRRATVSLTPDGGASWQPAGQTALPAVIGHAATPLADGPAESFDRTNRVEVTLAHDGMALQGATDDALVSGANLAWLGGELIQFGGADQVGPARWRLSQLVRGRRGTEWATAGHQIGEPFVLLDPATLLPLAMPLTAIGASVAVSVQGPGDDGVPVEASLVVAGAAVRPPAPVAIRASRQPDGAIALSWTRRSRLGWAWLDGGDATLGEDGERYRLDLMPATGRPRTAEVQTPGYLYTAAEQAEDGAGGAASLRVSLAMLGTSAASAPPATSHWTW